VRTLKSLNLPFSPDALEDAKALIRGQLQFYKSQPLSSDWFAIFIDGYWGKLRTEDGKVHDVVLFVAVGIDLEGTKHILGFWVLQGRERGAFWVQVLQDLVNRGVHRVLLLFTDDFRGLSEVIRKLFPYAEHQLCHLHLERNLKRKLSQDCYKQARRLLLRIRQARDREEGTVPFAALCQLVEQEKPQLAKHLQDCEENYLAFLGYPDEVRRHIYTTNVVEGLNAGIDRMRLDLGGYFPSQDCLEVNLFVQAVNLQDMWWRKPLPQVRAASYKLHQLFTLQYELDEEGAMLHNFWGKSLPGPVGRVEHLPLLASFPLRLRQVPPQDVSHCPFWEAQRVGDAPPAPAVLFSERKHCLLHLLWGLAGRALGTAGSIHKACFALLTIASNPLTDGVAGDGEPSGGLPEAAALIVGVDDLEAKAHFALLVGELVSFGERKGQQGGIPPFFKV